MANLYLHHPDAEDNELNWVKVKAVNIGTDEEPVYVVPSVLYDENGEIISTSDGLIRKETLTESELSEGKITFSNTMKGIIIVNESETNTLTYTINTIPVTLAAGESDEGHYEDFTEVTITGTSPDFRAVGLGA